MTTKLNVFAGEKHETEQAHFGRIMMATINSCAHRVRTLPITEVRSANMLDRG